MKYSREGFQFLSLSKVLLVHKPCRDVSVFLGQFSLSALPQELRKQMVRHRMVRLGFYRLAVMFDGLLAFTLPRTNLTQRVMYLAVVRYPLEHLPQMPRRRGGSLHRLQ